ncbi:MAG: DUF5689 domain-containing protein [Alistipes sp.]|jgi:hypothetical protein|nr:DUF5689 domain-containing protein [Alistipes sp.]
MRTAAAILLILALGSCRHWEAPRFDPADPSDPAALPNVTLGDLRTYLHEEAEMTFAEDLVLSGRVVSSDRAGNFYNTFFIDDGTGAAEIMAGMYDLDAVYRPGQRVTVRARGLAVGWRDGVMQIGLPPEPGNRFPTGYFYHPAVIRPYVTTTRDIEPVEPLDVSPDELSTSLCGRLVRIRGLAADLTDSSDTAISATWATTLPAPVTGYVRFRDTSNPDADNPNAFITVVTSGYASFASSPVPAGVVTLTGILSYGLGGTSREQFLLKLRDENDIDI